jgi:phenylpropionate dioxygenase-like ring-hydroxylating dioxygenase large terminal subunit
MARLLDRSDLLAMTRAARASADAGAAPQADHVMRMPASAFFDPDRFARERALIFRRLPLVLAAGAELARPGDYKALEAAGTPVLLTRGADGQTRAFVNACSHRGANVALPGCGHATRFTCPYHGWTFAQDGRLLALTAAHEFGDIDTSAFGLVRLPCLERAGLIWVILDPRSTLSIADFLCGYDAALAHFGFETWHFFDRRTIEGPNWKIAYDGYLDLYHLPVLHRNTFGPQMPNQALYFAWGPHQRALSPMKNLLGDTAKPEAEWGPEELLAGVWTIFPHVSIASFYAGGRAVMLSILLPGVDVGQSFTTQIYLSERPLDEPARAQAAKQFAMLEHVVKEEDYDTGLRQQRALASGARDHVLYGRNEGGAQVFHGWVERILAADDAALGRLFPSV